MSYIWAIPAHQINNFISYIWVLSHLTTITWHIHTLHVICYDLHSRMHCGYHVMDYSSHLQYGQFRYVRGSSMLSFCAFRMYTPTRKTAAHRLMSWERHDWDVHSITEWPQRFPFQVHTRSHWITKTRYNFLCCHHPNHHPFMILPSFFVMNISLQGNKKFLRFNPTGYV